MIIKALIPGKTRKSSFHDEEFEVLKFLYECREHEIWTYNIQAETSILFIRYPLEALKRKGLVGSRRAEIGNDAGTKPWWITDLGIEFVESNDV